MKEGTTIFIQTAEGIRTGTPYGVTFSASVPEEEVTTKGHSVRVEINAALGSRISFAKLSYCLQDAETKAVIKKNERILSLMAGTPELLDIEIQEGQALKFETLKLFRKNQAKPSFRVLLAQYEIRTPDHSNGRLKSNAPVRKEARRWGASVNHYGQ